MKSILRIALLVAIIALGLNAAVVPTRAASPCEMMGLSASDCKLIDDVNAAQAGVKIFTIDSWSIKVNVTGSPTGDVAADLSGKGAVDVSAVKMDASNLDSIYNGLKLVLSGSGSVKSPAEQKGDFEVRILDKTLYAKINNVWMKSDLAKLAASQASTIKQATSMGQMPMDMGMLAALPGLLKVAAADGPAVGDQKTRQFTYAIDLSALANEKSVADITKALGPAGAQVGALLPMFGEILKGVQITIVEYLGVDSKFVHGLDLKIAANIGKDAVAMLGIPLTSDLKADINFSVRITNQGKAITVEAVPDAKPMN